MKNTGFITSTQAARLAGVSSSTILRALISRKIRSFTTPGGHFRVAPKNVLAHFKPTHRTRLEELTAAVERWKAMGRPMTGKERRVVRDLVKKLLRA